MENKYYTPELSEFHIEFEYETYNMSAGFVVTDFSDGEYSYTETNTPTEKMWFKEKLRLPTMPLDTWSDLKEINKRIDESRVRVKYLDQKDLLELGWVEHLKSTEFTVEDGFWRVRIVNEGEIELDYKDNVDWKAGFILYKCRVKNKSEMRKLMEMLNIKKG